MSTRRTMPAPLIRPLIGAGSAEPASCDVIICCYTMARWDLLCAAVASVERQDADVQRLVIVVDHNHELLDRARITWPHHTVVPNAGVQGLSDARNTGIAECAAEAVAFLDDDAVADASWLSLSLAWFGDEHVAGTSALVEPVFEGARPGWFPAEFDWVIGCSYVGLPTSASIVRNPIGAAMVFRRRLFLEHGGFRHGLGRVGGGTGGCEETEFAIRVTAPSTGAHVIFDPEARATQVVPRDRQRLGYFVRRCYGEGIATAGVTAYAGGRSGTASERSYASMLPRAMMRDAAAAIRTRKSDPARRAGAVMIGFAATAAGFLRGRIRTARTSARVPLPRPPVIASSPQFVH